MDYNEIKKMMDDMGNSKIDELNIEFPDGIKISMKKNEKSTAKNDVITSATTQVNVDTQSIQKNITNETSKDGEKLKVVTSPMVGTFYSSSSPTEKPFVKIGDKVKKGDVLCIVEAMKLMNEVESEYDGEVVEICVKNEEMVDFGKPLFKLK